MKLSPKALAMEIVRLAGEMPQKDLPALMDAVATFLEHRGERKILRQLPYLVAQAFRRHHKLTPVHIVSSDSATAYDKDLIHAFEKAIEGKVEISEEEDPDLLGGMCISIGDERFDFSLSSALRSAKERLSAPF